jgi:hypothetical protein
LCAARPGCACCLLPLLHGTLLLRLPRLAGWRRRAVVAIKVTTAVGRRRSAVDDGYAVLGQRRCLLPALGTRPALRLRRLAALLLHRALTWTSWPRPVLLRLWLRGCGLPVWPPLRRALLLRRERKLLRLLGRGGRSPASAAAATACGHRLPLLLEHLLVLGLLLVLLVLLLLLLLLHRLRERRALRRRQRARRRRRALRALLRRRRPRRVQRRRHHQPVGSFVLPSVLLVPGAVLWGGPVRL